MPPLITRGRLAPVQAEAPSHQAHLVVRLETGPSPPLASDSVDRRDQVQDLISKGLAGAVVEPLFPAAGPALAAASEREEEPLSVLLDYLRIELPAELESVGSIAWLSRLPMIDAVYEEGPPMAPSLTATPHAGGGFHYPQRYLDPAPMGIDAEQAWRLTGGTGAGVGLIDVEQGWVLNHQNLPPGIPLLTGRNKKFFGHGTAVLGVVAAVGAVEKERGVVGIAPEIGGLGVVSQWWDEQQFSTPRALFAAATNLQAGDVLLLEAQTTCGQVPGLFPAEIEPAVQSVIRWAVARGITVVEAAGNGGLCLDGFVHPSRGRSLDRCSGAIMVGAATAGLQHARIAGSNFGRRVDCYAWGEWVATTGDGVDSRETTRFTERFSGTSAATAIVAGAAVVAQGIAKAHCGAPLSPAALRELFRDPTAGTPSARPDADRIGVMPDLKQVAARVLAAQRSYRPISLPKSSATA